MDEADGRERPPAGLGYQGVRCELLEIAECAMCESGDLCAVGGGGAGSCDADFDGAACSGGLGDAAKPGASREAACDAGGAGAATGGASDAASDGVDAEHRGAGAGLAPPPPRRGPIAVRMRHASEGALGGEKGAPSLCSIARTRS